MLISFLKHQARYKIHPEIDPLIESISAVHQDTGLYLHIPFCKHFCTFCPYHKFRYDENMLRTYTEAVFREFGLYPPREYDSLYVGGGTPTVHQGLLLELIRFFRPIIWREIGVELHPLDATGELLELMETEGVQYLSLGIQSMHDEVLRHFGRNHSARDNHRALSQVMNAGYKLVDVDLVFDLAAFSSEVVLKDFETVCAYLPHQISIYPMMRFSFAPYRTKNQPAREFETFLQIDKLALRMGYHRDMLWTYRRSGVAGRYSSVTRPFFRGIGISASSFNGEGFYVNTFDYDRYLTCIANARPPVSKRYRLSDWENALFYLFWSLYRNELNLALWCDYFPQQKARGRLLFRYLRLLGYLEPISPELWGLTQHGRKAFHRLEEWLTYAMIEPIWNDYATTPRARDSDQPQPARGP